MKRKGFIGVYPTHAVSKITGTATFVVRITVNGHKYQLGTYPTDWGAAQAYDRGVYISRPYVVRKRFKKSGVLDREVVRRDNEMLLGIPGMCFYTKEERDMLDDLERQSTLGRE